MFYFFEAGANNETRGGLGWVSWLLYGVFVSYQTMEFCEELRNSEVPFLPLKKRAIEAWWLFTLTQLFSICGSGVSPDMVIPGLDRVWWSVLYMQQVRSTTTDLISGYSHYRPHHTRILQLAYILNHLTVQMTPFLIYALLSPP